MRLFQRNLILFLGVALIGASAFGISAGPNAVRSGVCTGKKFEHETISKICLHVLEGFKETYYLGIRYKQSKQVVYAKAQIHLTTKLTRGGVPVTVTDKVVFAGYGFRGGTFPLEEYYQLSVSADKIKRVRSGQAFIISELSEAILSINGKNEAKDVLLEPFAEKESAPSNNE